MEMVSEYIYDFNSYLFNNYSVDFGFKYKFVYSLTCKLLLGGGREVMVRGRF